MTSINRLPTLLIFTALLIIFLAACGGEENNQQIPPFLLTATAVSDRGSESEEDPPGQEEAQAGGAEVQTAERAAQDSAVEEDGQEVDPFEVQPDGFGFRNYGKGFPEGDFTIADLWGMFGDGVCSRIDGEECIPTAEAQQWITDRNADMAYGHCIGFTVASYRFYDGDFQPQTFSSDAAAPFDIEQEAQIMRTIAANGALYWIDSVWSSEVSGTPAEVVEALIALDEPVDLSIFLPGLSGGHSLLAYDVVEVEPQLYHILVYDNNYPGEESYVIVDTAANTWRYDHGAINPNVEAIPYEGDATTNTLRFIPLSAYENAACPVCPVEAEEEEAEQGFSLLSFFGRGQALVTTESGSAVLDPGRFSSDIAGAQLIHQRGQLSADEIPDLVLPAGTDFTVQFNGLERVSSLNKDFALAIADLPLEGDQNQLTVRSADQVFDYQAGGSQSPVLKTTLHNGENSYDVTLLGVEMAAGEDLSLGLSPGGEALQLFSESMDISGATLLIGRLTAAGESIFGTTTLDLLSGQMAALDIATWDSLGSFDLFVDSDGDGTIDQIQTSLVNEPLDQLLAQSETAEVAAIVSSLSPLLDEQGLATVLDTLPDLGLSARNLGQILQPLELDDQQILDVIYASSLPVPELSKLIFSLRLDQERQDGLITDIGLSPADLAALEASLADLAFYHEVIVDWAFLDSNDPTQLAAYLQGQNLSTEQIAELLPGLGLNATDTELVLNTLNLSVAEIGQVLGDSDFNTAELEQLVGSVELSPEEAGELSALLGISLTVTPTATPGTATPAAGTATPTATIGSTMTPTPTASVTPPAGVSPTTTPTGAPAATAEPEATEEPTSTPPPLPESGPTPTPTPETYPGAEAQATPET